MLYLSIHPGLFIDHDITGNLHIACSLLCVEDVKEYILPEKLMLIVWYICC